MTFERLREDINTVFARDPAARSTLEIVFCYPGLHAIWFHRIAHRLWNNGHLFSARFLSHIARFLTGVEIHPGAQLGRRVFIDHGMGVVIGETAEVGDDVLIYMGVVLGGTALEKVKRHPTVEDNVIIGSGAILLGPVRIGSGAKIGAGSVVIRSVPPGATVVGVPGRIAGPESGPRTDLGPSDMPDPNLRVMSKLLDRQNRLEDRLRELESTLPTPGADTLRRKHEIETEIRDALREIIDPEVGIDIVDLGLIKDISVEDTTATINMVLTSKSCPLVDHLTDQVTRKAKGVRGIDIIRVNILDEPWNWDRFVQQKGDLKQI